jgi:hypothetical protein
MSVLIVILVILGTICGACIYGGIKMIKYGGRKAEPLIAPARIASPHGVEHTYARTARAGAALKRSWRPAIRLAGIGLIIAPFAAIAWVLWDLSHANWGPGMSKGRVLRLKNRAQLAEDACGDSWSGDAVEIAGALTPAERTIIGELWLLTARMEHASVAAFSQLALHLSALGAPARLLETTHRAALEEIRHARACFAIVEAITGTPHSAGPIPALATASTATVDLTRLAIGSLIDGCLAEGIAADVAARSAATTTDPSIHAALSMIAREELGHAELAWDVLAWCLELGGPKVHAAVHARIQIMDRELAPRLPDFAGVEPATLARFGVIDQDSLGELASARIAAVRARAARLLVADAPALAA